MAFTERYVTDAAAGGGDGQIGTPWTLAEALTNAVAGDRVNILSDSGYSLGADTVTNVGTISDLIVFRGYNSSIGDLEGLGWNADGSLNVTDFPVITLTGLLQANQYVHFEALSFTGARSAVLIGDTTVDRWSMAQCKVVNTQNNAAARCVQFDNNGVLINCDFECSGAAHGFLVNGDVNTKILGCRFKLVAASPCAKFDGDGEAIGCVFIGNGGVGIGVQVNEAAIVVIANTTFYDLAQALVFPNTAMTYAPILFNNHVTDCGEYINSLYSGTADLAVLEFSNRTRDNTTPRTGIGDGVNVDEITTDTGGIATDYTDAGSDDLTLISAAPGKATGMRRYTDIGGLQRQEPAGGGGLLVHPGTSGGARG